MEINLFLWPMLIPMLLPLFFCIKFKKETLFEIVTIALVMMLIVLLYWPLITSNIFSTYTYVGVKILLFVILPLVIFLLIKRNTSPLHIAAYGITKEGVKKSIVWFILLLPIMLIITGLIQYYLGMDSIAELIPGVVSFFEAFTEEFFFRGILFMFLLQKSTMKIAYVTSLASFTLMHPQNLATIFIIGTIIQGILTLEITRRSHNILGAWMLHGSNRFFELVLLPWLM
jgi:membrane protease YdiL (CAAX protease family)